MKVCFNSGVVRRYNNSPKNFPNFKGDYTALPPKDEFIPLDKEETKKGLIKGGLDEIPAMIIAKYVLDKSSFEKALELVAFGDINPFSILSILGYKNDWSKKQEELSELGVSRIFSNVLISFDDKKYDTAYKLIENGLNPQDVISLIMLDEKQYQPVVNQLDTFLVNPDFKQGLSTGKTQLDIEVYSNPGGSKAVSILAGWYSNGLGMTEPDDPDGAKIEFYQVTDEDGNSTLERREKFPDGRTETRTKTSNKSYITYKKDDKVIEQFELTFDDNSYPDRVLHKKRSEIVDGAYDSDLYLFNSYDEDIDVIESIKKGTLLGIGLSKAKILENGAIVYSEISNAAERSYFEQNGSYYYTIKTPYKTIERSFTKMPDGSTFTTVNNKKYIAKFDDETFTVQIQSQDEAIPTAFDFYKMTKGKKEVFDVCKNLPADVILDIAKYVTDWSLCQDKNAHCGLAGYFSTYIATSEKLATIAHEVGHAKENAYHLEFDKNLIEIYNSEIKEYNNSRGAFKEDDFVKYFSPIGGGEHNSGLNELIAEANLLFVTYNHKSDLSARAEYLVNYFPRTLSYIAEKFGY